MEELILTAGNEQTGIRLDVFIASETEALSRNAIQKLIEQAHVTVNGAPAKSNYRLRQNDLVYVLIPDPVSLAITAENIPLDILYEDGDLLVINKPKGMVVHPAPGHYSGTLVNAVLFHCGESLSGINGVTRPGIVHRIDKDTSGILVVAKTNTAHNGLAAQLAAHRMQRVYYALVFNNIKKDEGTINQPLGRSPSDRKKMAAVNGGKHAVTHFKVLERFGKYTLIEAKLETGRTHQIRAHLSGIGHPLVGDTVYGPEKQPFKLQGQTLHAGVLGFVHPATGEYLEFRSALPTYFETLLMRLRS